MKPVKNIIRFLLILFTCCTMFFISMYWILSSTLLNPVFFDLIMDTQESQEFIGELSKFAEQNGLAANERLIRENMLSLINGLIRYITVEDMSFSDISIDNENITALKSTFSEAYDRANIPDILRIHPFVLSYFIPGLEKFYYILQTVRSVYVICKTLYPLLVIISLLNIFIYGKLGKNMYTPLSIVSFPVAITGLVVKCFQYRLFISPVEGFFHELVPIIKPFISKLTFYLFFHCVMTAVFLFITAAILKALPVKRLLAEYSGNISILFAIILFLILITYRHDFSPIFDRELDNNHKTLQVYTLIQNEGAVHSLMIKLLEEGSDLPARDVKVIANKIDYPYNPFYITTFTDSSGNARLILPGGLYLLYVYEPTLPPGYNSFDPVVLKLSASDNSFYTIHLPKKRTANTRLKIQTSGMYPYPY